MFFSKIVPETWSLISPFIDDVLDELYDHALAHDTTAKLFAGHNIDGLKAVQKTHWELTFKNGCHNYALLAAGHIDLVMEDSLAPHDMIAVVAVMQAAGAVVTDTAGQPIRLGQSSSILAAATADLHAAALTALAEVAAD